MQHTATNKTI